MRQQSFESRNIENLYRRSIDALFRRFLAFPDSNSLEVILETVEKWKTADLLFGKLPELMARRMITMVTKTSHKHWQEAASESARGKELYRLINRETSKPVLKAKIHELLEENAKLIKTVPYDTARHLTKLVQREQLKGLRSDYIVYDIKRKAPHLLKWQAKRIARTEVSKATTAITQVRAQEIGLNWYQWETVLDARTRESHRNMDRVLVNFNDMPSPEALVGEKDYGKYNAGNIFNCRCEALPITSLDEISWPARVYSSGKIKVLTRKQFVLTFLRSQKELAA